MSAADIDIGVGPTLTGRFHDMLGLIGLFGLLSAFTLTTFDGGEIAPRIISVIFFILAAAYLSFPSSQRLTLSLPAACLLLMTCWGLGQTLWSSQKIVYNGWTGVLFWFTAAMITLLATQVFQRGRAAAQFRLAFIVFGSAICVLDLLQQATHADRYFWLVDSRYHVIFGSFAYWNNFAQFVELLLPVTLWQALGSKVSAQRKYSATPYLVLAAIQVGAVVASGSRAGAALVLTELVVVVGAAYLRERNKNLLYAAALAVFLSVVFIYAAGYETVAGKLQQRDQLNVRRGINAASFEMIRQRPLTGWGLDTYVPVYRMFARYDDGTFVNRAHNDWLQWTAEGGIFFSALMLVVFIWSVRPAYRSGWGLGLVAICLHAIVDYPFARFGVCGWYFALIAMLATHREERLYVDPPASRSSGQSSTGAKAQDP